MALETKIPIATDIIFPVYSFVGGMNTRSSSLFLSGSDKFSLKPNELTLLTNLIRTSSGALTTRPGRVKVNSSPVVPPGGDAVIRSLFELRQASGTNRIFMNAGNSVYYLNGSTWTSVSSALTANARVHWAQFQNLAIGVNGVDAPFKVDGTPTLTTPLGGSPPTAAVAVASYRNRCWMLKDQTLSYSALGNAEDWTTANNAGSLPIPVTLGRKGTALFPFWDRLEVFTHDQCFEVVGTGPADFSLRAVNFRYGHQATPHSVIAAGNEVYFMNNRGLHQLSSTLSQSDVGELTVSYASAKIEPTWLDITPGNIPNMMAAHDVNRNLLIILCNPNGTLNTQALVADYFHLDEDGRPTWSVYSNFAFASITTVTSLNEIPEILLGDYTGTVYRQTEDETDDGTVIPLLWQYVTDLGNPGFLKTFRYLLLHANVNGTGATCNIGVTPDFGLHISNVAVDISQPAGDTIGGTFMIGFSALGVLTFYPRLIPIPSHGRFLTMNFTVNFAHRVTIGGMTFYAGYRRALGI